MELNTHEGVQNAIFNEVHWKQYNLAEEAPIRRGFLRGQFGYMSTSPTARAVLDGSYDFPPDIDNATKELFEECAKIQSIIPANSVTGAISREQWQQQWKKVEEDTSLSPSGLNCWGGLQSHLSVPRPMGFPGIEEGHRSGTLGKRIVGDAREHVWHRAGLETPGYPSDGGRF